MSNSKQMTLNDGDDVFIAAKFSHWGVGSQNERVAYLHVGSETVLFPEKYLAVPPIATFRALAADWDTHSGPSSINAYPAKAAFGRCARELLALIAEAEKHE